MNYPECLVLANTNKKESSDSKRTVPVTPRKVASWYGRTSQAQAQEKRDSQQTR